ncbi:MAG: hypothetical protein Q8P57_03875 [Candidatus Pacearchaeota archaeon]|nr:hypothetical protein [Candidatus Pacearchaeota archaeon]
MERRWNYIFILIILILILMAFLGQVGGFSPDEKKVDFDEGNKIFLKNWAFESFGIEGKMIDREENVEIVNLLKGVAGGKK